jgi:hypothetical protein
MHEVIDYAWCVHTQRRHAPSLLLLLLLPPLLLNGCWSCLRQAHYLQQKMVSSHNIMQRSIQHNVEHQEVWA